MSFMIEQIVDMEARYLGCILVEGSLIHHATLKKSDFLKPEHQAIYSALHRLRREGKDVNIVSFVELGEKVVEECGGFSYIDQVANSVLSVHEFEQLQAIIRQNAVTRQVLQLTSQFQAEAQTTLSAEPLQKFIDQVSKIEVGTSRKTISFQEKVRQRVEEHTRMAAQGLSGIDTGFQELNRVTDGWQPGDLVYIGARPSMGKTAFVINSFLRAALKNQDIFVTFFSIEMATGQIIDRLIAALGGINLFKLRNPNKHFTESDEWHRYTNAVGILEGLNIDIRDENTLPEIRAAVRQNWHRHSDKRHIVFIDYLTLIRPVYPRPNRHHEIEEISRGLKDIARDFNIPVVTLAQLNRSVEQRQNKRPMLSDLRESGSIEQDADLVLFLYRDDYYNPDTQNKGIVEILIPKNRNGEAGTYIELFFDREKNVFTDLVREREAEALA